MKLGCRPRTSSPGLGATNDYVRGRHPSFLPLSPYDLQARSRLINLCPHGADSTAAKVPAIMWKYSQSKRQPCWHGRYDPSRPSAHHRYDAVTASSCCLP